MVKLCADCQQAVARKRCESQRDCVARAARGRIVFMSTWRAGVIAVFFLGVFGLFARAGENAAPLPVTMIVPGFVVRELPINLTNITSLEYAADGKLWALGYDGRVHVLSDTDGDGVEDSAKTWWQPKDAKAFRGPIGMKV